MPRHRHRGIVAQISVHGPEPEEVVAPDGSAEGGAEGPAPIPGRPRHKREHGNGCRGCGRGFLQPLSEGIFRAPDVLAVVEGRLSMQRAGADAGSCSRHYVHVGSAAYSAVPVGNLKLCNGCFV